jgi:hypothetical protein
MGEVLYAVGQAGPTWLSVGWALMICGFWVLCWQVAALLGGDW